MLHIRKTAFPTTYNNSDIKYKSSDTHTTHSDHHTTKPVVHTAIVNLHLAVFYTKSDKIDLQAIGKTIRAF